MFGLGKKRSKLGKFIDKYSVSTVEFAKETGVSRRTLTKACNEADYVPSPAVMKKILKSVRKVDPDIDIGDFWDI
ncbi:helix-turn-helix domain-containing protein [Alkalihalophilus marmarensis]|uniref:transcriptional regulator n=1 Tax=Alkalihalophilus marmarensis TaxID=521377 RepID=UPI002DBDD270|nr:transcriptional regulator [Alkalihalophilus marmarensis]MEC2074304.1 transcriptional regulator [Alkalihalophilus marmarensis]